MEKFSSFALPPALHTALQKMGYEEPTPIQAAAIPVILDGHDMAGLAQTGTGKTAAFMLPLLAHLLNDPHATALILTPTRELGQQIFQFALKLLDDRSILSVLLIGGQRYDQQRRLLKRGARLMIGTPGRVVDHLQQGSLKLDRNRVFVLDEADRLLDMGFEDQIRDVLKFLPEEKRQTLLFSATMSSNIRRLMGDLLKEPKEISIGTPNRVADKIEQSFIKTDDKINDLYKAIDEREGSILVFVNSQRGVEKVSELLHGRRYRVEHLHGGMRQARRDRVLKSFRQKRFQILVATDVAARGLDIPHIEHVINYELPLCPEDYIHRIGRTARAQSTGQALSFVGYRDFFQWKKIERFLAGKKESEPSGRRFKPKKRYGSAGGRRFDGGRKRNHALSFS